MDFLEKIVIGYLKAVNRIDLNYTESLRYRDYIKVHFWERLIQYIPLYSVPSQKKSYNFILEEKFNIEHTRLNIEIDKVMNTVCNIDNKDINIGNATYYQLICKNREKRHSIDEFKSYIYERSAILEYERYVAQNEYFMRKCGKTYLEICAHIGNREILGLKNVLKNIISKTDEKYSNGLKKLGLIDKYVKRCDIVYAINHYTITKSHVEQVVRAIIRSLGRDDCCLYERVWLKEGRSLVRPYCVRIKPPDDSYAIINLAGGIFDIVNALHEIGHIIYDLYSGRTKIDWYLPKREIDEYMAILIEYLATNPKWLRQFFALNDAEEIAYKSDFFELFSIRKYCGLALYEMSIYSSNGTILPFEECRKKYREILKNVYRCDVNDNECMHVIEPHFMSYFYSMANIRAKKVKEALEMKHGNLWYQFIDVEEMLNGEI